MSTVLRLFVISSSVLNLIEAVTLSKSTKVVPYRRSSNSQPAVETRPSENTLTDSTDGTASVKCRSELLKKTLEEANVKANHLRSRITFYTIVVGAVFVLTSISLGVYSSLWLDVLGPPQYYFAFTLPFLSKMLMGVMPGDVKIIRFLSFGISAVLLVLGIPIMLLSCRVWFTQRHLPTGYEGNDTFDECGSDLPEVGCAIFAARAFIQGTVLTIFGVLLAKNLKKVDGQNIYDHTRRKGFRYKDSAFKIPARLALKRIWWYFRLTGVFFALSSIINTLILYAVGDLAPYYQKKYLAANVFFGTVWLAESIFFTASRRRKILAWLVSVVAEDQAKDAASIAALLGGLKSADGLTMAKEKFRAIPFTALTEEDFCGNKEKSSDTNTIFGKTSHVQLGHCDVFMSHSWSDDGPKKYAALQSWAQNFYEEHGRHPVVWLDKACINQNDIDNDLMCLPIFLAGCDNLVIIAGPTYTERLWCILEVFVFLKMGGNTERITVLPIGMDDEQTAVNMFSSADVQNCKCFHEKDKQKILGIIEQGFGNFQQFNEIIRQVFTERMEADRLATERTATVNNNM